MKKKVIVIIVALVVLWVAAGLIDYARVSSFEKPFFCISTNSADDGGSGHYQGLGYSFEIKGNFMPEDELPGVTRYTYFLFGNEVVSGIRD